MKNIQIRILALLVAFLVLTSIYPAQTAASEKSADPKSARVQVLCDPVAPAREDHPSHSPLGVGENYSAYVKDSTHEGLIDLYGRTILPPEYFDVKYLTGDAYSICKEFACGYALYIGGVRLTEYAYRSISVEGMYLVAKYQDDSRDFFYHNGIPVKLPKITSGWEIYGLADDSIALLRRVVNENEGGKIYEYNFCTWDGKMILPYPTSSSIKRIETTEKVVYRGNGGGYDYYLSNGKFLGHYGSLTWIPECSLFFAYGPGDSCYYIDLFDEAGNVFLETTAPKASMSHEDYTTSEFGILTKNLMYISVNDTKHRIFNMANEDVLNIEIGKLILQTHSHVVDEPNAQGFGAVVDGVFSLYDASGALLVESEANDIYSAFLYGEYAVAIGEDQRLYYYSAEGELLFEVEADQNMTYQDGVLLQEKDGLYAVCGSDGNPITEYIYQDFAPTRSYGILNMRRNGETGYYLVNAAGEELNQESYYTKIEFTNGVQRKTSYTLDGKTYGILRYIGVNESIFMDVPSNAWYFDAVEYCYESGLFSGTALAQFSPEEAMTRAMLVTVLWRLEGEPAAQKSGEFTDVMPGLWYSQAVQWAAENGIVNGVGKGEFDPDGEITREQMATVIFRYGKWKGYDLEDSVELGKFPDASSVSSYAVEAISWANAAGIINGSDEGGTLYLQPQGKATRAQVAAILMRFIENFLN